MNRLSEFKNPRRKILFLGYDRSETNIIDSLIKENCNVDHTDKEITAINGYDFAISYGYRHILKKEIIKNSKCPIFNLHISYLPFNRGAHPNFWSFYDKTPSGVTIHIMDEGIDTGPIVAQKYVNFKKKDDTFSKTYEVLKCELEKLFLEILESLLLMKWICFKQIGEGSNHRKSDLPRNFSGWGSKINEEIDKLYKEGLLYD